MTPSLKKKFLIPVISLMILGLGAATAVNYLIARRSIEREIKSRLTQTADSLSAHLTDWMTIIKMDIDRLRRENYFKMAVRDTFIGERARAAANSYLAGETEDMYDSLNLANLQGKVICSSSPRSIDRDISETSYFKASLSGQPYTPEAFLPEEGRYPVFAVSYPVLSNRRVIGVFFGIIRLAHFNRHYIDPVDIGERGYAFMLDQSGGAVIAHPDPDRIFRTGPLKASGTSADQELMEYEERGERRITAVKINPETGWRAAVTVAWDDIMGTVKLLRRMNILITILLASLMAAIIASLVGHILKPVIELVYSAKTIAEGNYDVPVRAGDRDEIGMLVESVETMRIAIKRMTKRLREQERIRKELEIAKTIQSALIPVRPRMAGYEITASLQPSNEVGGDYYDIISAGGHDWIVVGDVSGHGLTAGLVMMMAQTSIHTVLNQHPDASPADMLSAVNKTIYGNLERMNESKHMTIVALASVRNGDFVFAGQHEDILIARQASGTVESVEIEGMWLGIEPDISPMLRIGNLSLSPGDCMVLYTDGISEARGRGESVFGVDRIRGILETQRDQSAMAIHDAIFESLQEYETLDDITLVVIKRKVIKRKDSPD